MGNSQVRSSLTGSSRNTASPQAQSRIWAQLFGPRWLFLLSLFPSKGSDEVPPAPQHVSCPSSRRSIPEALLSPAAEEEGLEGFSVLRVSNFFFQPRVHLHLHTAYCPHYPGPRVPVGLATSSFASWAIICGRTDWKGIGTRKAPSCRNEGDGLHSVPQPTASPQCRWCERLSLGHLAC